FLLRSLALSFSRSASLHFPFLLVCLANFCKHQGGNNMEATEEQTLEKAVWHYVGVTVLWLSLFFSGVALERLGLTTWILSGTIPGEVGGLRTQVAECQRNLGTVDEQRHQIQRTEASLRVEVKRLQDQLATATGAKPSATP